MATAMQQVAFAAWMAADDPRHTAPLEDAVQDALRRLDAFQGVGAVRRFLGDVNDHLNDTHAEDRLGREKDA